MDWIKKHYEQFALALLAAILLAVSSMLILKARSLSVVVPVAAAKNANVPPLDLAPFEKAEKMLEKSAVWGGHQGSLFVSRKYLVKNEKLVDPTEDDGQLHAPIPNAWIQSNGLDILSSTVLEDDADGDGFTNLDEWTGNKADAPGAESTDPQKKDSHPPFITKLRLKRAIKKQFRLIVQSWEGDAANLETLSFQINTLDVKQPTQFVKFAETIANTKFKITKFEKKQETDANGVEKDVSEVTLENQETKELVVLVMGKIVDSPDSFALFQDLLTQKEFGVKKDQEFSLAQQPDYKYKLVDINEGRAVIQALATGQKLDIPKP